MSSTNKVSHQDITAAGLSEADQNINNSVEDKSHEAAGHKANLSNPSTSLYSVLSALSSGVYNVTRHERGVQEAIRESSQGTRWRASFLRKAGQGRIKMSWCCRYPT